LKKPGAVARLTVQRDGGSTVRVLKLRALV
jgi:hypothetical protein